MNFLVLAALYRKELDFIPLAVNYLMSRMGIFGTRYDYSLYRPTQKIFEGPTKITLNTFYNVAIITAMED